MPRLSLWDKRKIYYVYGLIDPRSNQYLYIGSGKKSRAKDHLREAENNNVHRKGANLYKIRTIQKILTEGKEPIIEYIYATPDRQIASQVEIEFIQKIGRADLSQGPLTNLTDGGDGLINRSQESIDKNTNNAKETKANWTKEKRNQVKENVRQSLLKRWSNYTDEEVYKYTNHLRQFWQTVDNETASEINKKPWANRTYEEKLSLTEPARQAAQEYKENNKEEFRRRTSEGLQKHWANQTDEDKEKRINRRKNTISQWSDDYKQNLCAKIGRTKSKNIQSETTEERQNRINKHKEGFHNSPNTYKSIANLKNYRDLSPEEQEEYKKVMSSSIKRMWDNMTPEERELRKQKQRFTRLRKRFEKLNVGDYNA